MIAEQIDQAEGLRLVAPAAPPEPLPATPRRVLPKRIVKIPLPAPYDDFSVTAWVNYPNNLRRELKSGDEERTRAAFQQILLGHDLVDFDGKPYPLASDPAFWDEITVEVGAVIYDAIEGQLGKLDPPSAAR